MGTDIEYAYYAHELVRRVLTKCETLEFAWLQYRARAISSGIEGIEKLIIKLRGEAVWVNDNSARKVFRYFCCARLYSLAIFQLFRNQNKIDRINLDGINIEDLNILANQILGDFTSFQTNSCSFDGNRATNFSPGGIPFMKVFSDDNVEVSIRRGFELNHKIRKRARKVESFEDRLHCYSIMIKDNGKGTNDFLDNYTIRSMLPVNEHVLHHVLLNKFITRINISFRSSSDSKTRFEIDVLDREIYRYPRNSSVNVRLLQNISGATRTGWKTEITKDSGEEDLLITYFSSIFVSDIFHHDDGKLSQCDKNCPDCLKLCESIEIWSSKRIKSFVTNVNENSDNKMYLGFCFRTLMEAGYSDEHVTNSPTNVLLLALTRGTSRLIQNYGKLRIFLMPRAKSQPRKIGVIGRKLIFRHKSLLTAGPQGIEIRTKHPRLFHFLLFFALIPILLYCILLGKEQYHRRNWEEYFSGLVAIATAIFGVIVLLAKILYNSWDYADLFQRRKIITSFSELKNFLPGAKEEAILLCSLLRNPNEVFSRFNSSSFAVKARGTFNMDEDLHMSDLQNARFKFGVDYYGNPVMFDNIGRVRRIHFPEAVCHSENQCKITSYEDFLKHREKCTNVETSGVNDKDDELFGVWNKNRHLEECLITRKSDRSCSLRIGEVHNLKIVYLFELQFQDLAIRTGELDECFCSDSSEGCGCYV